MGMLVVHLKPVKRVIDELHLQAVRKDNRIGERRVLNNLVNISNDGDVIAVGIVKSHHVQDNIFIPVIIYLVYII